VRIRRTKSRNGKLIPPPPGPEKGHNALIEYFNTFSTEDLEKAGHLETPSVEEMRELEVSAAYDFLCANGLCLKFSRKECERLARLAVDNNVSVDELVKEWLKERLHLEGRRKVNKKTSVIRP
jgi:hypothetical protein